MYIFGVVNWGVVGMLTCVSYVNAHVNVKSFFMMDKLLVVVVNTPDSHLPNVYINCNTHIQ